MKYTICLLLSMLPVLALAQPASGAASAPATVNWFTVMGDPANPDVNTIEVNPVPLEISDAGRTMRIRVSRSTQRTSWDGIAYRSYTATVAVNCSDGRAQYLSLNFHRDPLWRGTAYRTSVFTREQQRPMLFLDVEPNPTQRIIRAACL